MIPVIVTPYAFRGSIIRIEKLPRYLKELGFRSAVIADPNFHAHVIFNETLRKEGITPVHALAVGKKLLIAKSREGFESLVRFKNEGLRKLKGVMVVDFEEFRPVMYFKREDRLGYEAMRRVLGLDIREGDFSLESGGDDPTVLYRFKPYDLKVKQAFPGPPKDWVKIEEYPEDWRERLKRELDLVKKKGFEGYFRAVQIVVETARRMGIRVGPGRGSAVGSLLAYVLGITSINPLEYDLLFERFINEGRKDLPDIDIDVEDVRRRELIKELEKMFGFVSLVSTFSNLKEQSLRKTLKELGYKKNKKLYDLLYELPVRRSIHAAGIVISASELNIPYYVSDGLKVSEYDMRSLSLVGVEKIDVLGLRTLSLISDLVERTGLETEEIPLSDEKTFEAISSGTTTAVFQLESSEARMISKYVSPKSIVQLSHVLALNRPGPLKARLHEEYLERRLGKNWKVLDELKGVLDETLGLPIYQEQIMMMASKLAGMSLSEADELRKAISKKDEKKMKDMVLKLKRGMAEKGFDDEFVEKTVDFIKKFASYAFNKSHSVAYAHLSYYLTYYKIHFFPQFLMAFIDTSGDREKLFLLLMEASFLGYEILKPSVLKPEGEVDGRKIRLPIHVVRGIPKDLVSKIGKVEGVGDFVRKVGSTSMAESLIKAGAFDEIYRSRKEALIALKEGDSHILLRKLRMKFGELESGIEPESLKDRILLERESMGFSLSIPDFKSERAKLAEAYSLWERRVSHVLSLGSGIITDGRVVVFADRNIPEGELAVVLDPDEGVVDWERWEGELKIECENEGVDVKIVCREKLKR